MPKYFELDSRRPTPECAAYFAEKVAEHPMPKQFPEFADAVCFELEGLKGKSFGIVTLDGASWGEYQPSMGSTKMGSYICVKSTTNPKRQFLLLPADCVNWKMTPQEVAVHFCQFWGFMSIPDDDGGISNPGLQGGPSTC